MMMFAVCGWLDRRVVEEAIRQSGDVDQSLAQRMNYQSLAQWMNCLLIIGRCRRGRKPQEVWSRSPLTRAAESYVVYGWRDRMEAGVERRRRKEATERSERGAGQVETTGDRLLHLQRRSDR